MTTDKTAALEAVYEMLTDYIAKDQSIKVDYDFHPVVVGLNRVIVELTQATESKGGEPGDEGDEAYRLFSKVDALISEFEHDPEIALSCIGEYLGLWEHNRRRAATSPENEEQKALQGEGETQTGGNNLAFLNGIRVAQKVINDLVEDQCSVLELPSLKPPVVSADGLDKAMSVIRDLKLSWHHNRANKKNHEIYNEALNDALAELQKIKEGV